MTSVAVGNENIIESVVGDAWRRGPPDFIDDAFRRLRLDTVALFRSIGSARAPTEDDVLDISKCYSVAFLIQTMLYLNLHFCASRDNDAPVFAPLLAPLLHLIEPASQYEEPHKLGSAACTWPWLRDGLAGTPLAGLSFTSGHQWTGVYTYIMDAMYGDHPVQHLPDDTAMEIELFLAPPPAADSEAHNVYLRGEGIDNMGEFTLNGECDTRTGVVDARKAYVGAHWCDSSWNGLVTPFGMVGVWGNKSDGDGWWWIWPEVWSERSPVPAAVAVQHLAQ